MTPSSTNHRVTSLDTLRGLAVLLVIALHCAFAFPSLLQVTKGFSLAYGQFGVQLFFIISGFTMLLTFKGAVCKKTVCSFYIRRVFRIVPLFLLAGIFYLLKDGVSARYWAPNGISWKDIALTFSFMHWLTPTAFNSVVPGGWSIAVEMQFYFIFPLFYFFLGKGRGVIPYAAITFTFVVSVIFARLYFHNFLVAHLLPNESHLASEFVYLWLPHQLPCFGFGFLLYQLVEKNEFSPIGLLLLALPCVFSSWGLTVLFLFLLCFFVLTQGISLAPISRIGVLSYSMYLVHFATIGVVRAVADRWHGVHLRAEVALPIVIVITAAVSQYITKPLIEDPSVSLGKKISRRFFPARPMDSVQA